MVEINHEIKIKAPLEKVYQAISTIDGLQSWYSKKLHGNTELNGHLIFEAKDKPTFEWKIIQKDPKKIIWECVKGPGNAPGTKVIYALSSAQDGRTLVEFSHTEWPGQQGNYRKCNTLWGILLHHLKNYAETEKTEPALQS